MIKQIKKTIISSLFLVMGVWLLLPPKQALSYTLTNNNTEQTPLRSNQETLIASPYNLMSPYPYPLGNSGNGVYRYNRYGYNRYPSRNYSDSWNRNTPRSYYDPRRVDHSYPYQDQNPRYRNDRFNCTTITQGVSNPSGFTTIRHEFCH
jgi:hypothetical protein